jgi:hypothetical protein
LLEKQESQDLGDLPEETEEWFYPFV